VLNAPVGTYLATSDISTQSNALLVATTDSSDVALERIRSIMSQTSGSLSYGDGYVVSGKYAQKPVINPIIEELAGLAYAGIAITMLIAAGGLIVSTISGLLERKRSLLNLRLSGMTVGQLKRLVQIESVVPLIAASIISAALGVEVAKTFMNIATSTLTTVLPDWRYYAIVATCLVLAFAGITGVLAGLDRMTGFEENRAE
jgi:ABC-type antimicrobial peptide transport system permease subunit